MTQTTSTRGGTDSRTIADLVPLAAQKYAEHVALTTKADGGWRETSYSELGSIVAAVARCLTELGLTRGDRVSIFSETRPEWTYAGLAVSMIGGAIVPIYPSSTTDECKWVLGNSGARAVICGTASQLDKVLEIRGDLPALEYLVVIDEEPRDDVISFAMLRERGAGGGIEDLASTADAVKPEDPCSIVYTSGTTGRPKGCVLSHGNFRAVLHGLAEIGSIRQGDRTYMFLPLAHVFSQVLQLVTFDQGGTVAYWGGDPARIIPELGEVSPTYFPSVPRIFEKIYAMAAPDLEARMGKDRFREIVALGTDVRTRIYAGEEIPDEERQEWKAVDEQIFAKVRSIFGGEIREAATGAAPIDKEVLEFFFAAGIPVLEGYGMTETATAITVSTPEHHKFGTVGRPIPGIELRIGDDGEILVKGPNVFHGYHRDDEATAEVLVDGWLHTGDLGEIDQEGYVTITGRKKDIIITAGGKNIAPASLENEVKRCRYVSHAVMHGDRRPFPTMLVTLDGEEIAAWARDNGKPEDLAELSRDADVIALVQHAIDEANEQHASAAQVKKFFILEHDLSHEAGELTPTMKVKRRVIDERYAPRFDALYAS